MKAEERRNFDIEAEQWDLNPERIKLANDVADAIIMIVKPTKNMDVLDFGCGTGLVTLRLQLYVRCIIGVDSSKGMLSVLNDKVARQGFANVYTQFVDFGKGVSLTGAFDLIVSSMTVHHVPDTGMLFRMWHQLLKPEGRLYFADLDTEGGLFHSDNTGVFHFGFDREELKKLLQESGFRDVSDTTAATVVRDVAGAGNKELSIFLIGGRR